MVGEADFLARHHDHLAAWLRDGDAGRLDAFITAHHDAFSLVTTSGATLDLVTLRESLRAAGATQPGLAIEIHEVTNITAEVHRFTEIHAVDSSVVEARIVTAVIKDGHLLTVHETTRH